MTDIIERWQGSDLPDPEAVEALREAEEAILDVEEEANERGMSDAEFAIYTHLTEETPEAIDSDAHAEAIAKDIVEAFEERVDRDYTGWKTNQRTMEEIERVLLDTLAVEYDLADLITENEHFIDDIRGYLLANYE